MPLVRCHKSTTPVIGPSVNLRCLSICQMQKKHLRSEVRTKSWQMNRDKTGRKPTCHLATITCPRFCNCEVHEQNIVPCCINEAQNWGCPAGPAQKFDAPQVTRSLYSVYWCDINNGPFNPTKQCRSLAIARIPDRAVAERRRLNRHNPRLCINELSQPQSRAALEPSNQAAIQQMSYRYNACAVRHNSCVIYMVWVHLYSAVICCLSISFPPST